MTLTLGAPEYPCAQVQMLINIHSLYMHLYLYNQITHVHVLTYSSYVHEFAYRLLYVVYELFNNPVVNFTQMCLFVVFSIIWLDPLKNKRSDFVHVCQVTFHYYKYSLTGTLLY